MNHGTNACYQNHGCRCDECKAAHALYVKEWRAKGGTLRQPARREPVKVNHGTNDGYVSHGCRCDECRAAHNRYIKAWRAKGGAAVESHRQAERATQRTLRAAWAWLQENRPDVAAGLRAAHQIKETAS